MSKIESRIGVTPHPIVKEAKGVKIELDVIIITHVDGSCHAFCDAGRHWQDDPATKSYCGVFHSSGRDKDQASKQVFKQAERFAEELVQQKIRNEAASDFKKPR